MSTIATVTTAGLGAVALPAQADTALAPLQVGARPNATTLGFTLADRVQATVDVGTGNLQVLTSDLTLPGIGADLTLGLDFNSLLLGPGSPLPAGSAGPGWAMRLGADTKLISNTDNSVFYLGPDGVEYLFTPGPTGGSYVTPAGLKATLTGGGSGGWTLLEHSSGRLSTFNGAGKLVSRADRNANPTTFAYGNYGYLSKITSTRGTTTNRYAKVSTDPNSGQLLGLTQYAQGGGNRSVSYGYTAGRLTSLTDLAGRVTQFDYDSTTGDLTSVTNPGGAVTQFGYNSEHKVNRITQLNPTAGSPGNSVTRLSYPSGSSTLVADPTTDQGQIVSAVPHTSYSLDGSDRVMTAVDPVGNTRSRSYTATGFDTASSTIGTGTTGSTATATYTANSGESLTSAAAPTGATAALAYGNTGTGAQYLPSGGTDAQGNTSAYGYDTAGNQTSATDASAATASVSYHADGTVATATDPGNPGNPTSYTTDSDPNSTPPPTHQLLSITPVTGGSLGVRSFSYDGYARLQSATDGAGHTTSYAYDDLNRTTSVSYSDTTVQVSYGYDTTGRLATRTDASGTTSYGYDALNHLTSRVNTHGGGTLSYGYDKAGHQSSLTDSRGTTSYSYDPAGQLASATTSLGTLLQFEYDDHGRRTDTWNATDTTNSTWALHSHTDYDTSGRPAHVIAEKGDTARTKVADLTYCYAQGNTNPTACSTTPTQDRPLLQSSKDNLTGAISSYGYDTSNRLTAVTTTGGPAPVSYAYSYDSNGNRTTVTTGGTTTTTGFNPANQISDPGSSYDGAGNLTTSPTLGALTYNAAGQLTAATNPGGGNGSYTYADRNQNELVAQTVPGGTTIKYTYGRTDRNGLPQIEQVAINGATGYLEHDPTTGQPLALRITNGNEAFYVFDGLSRPTALVTSAGTTSNYAYDPYGVTTTSGSGAAGGQNPYRYAPGSTYDRTTGMLKYGQRWYEPTTGRFTQQDSITHLANPAQGNKYAYAGGDPINRFDPTGAVDCGSINFGLAYQCLFTFDETFAIAASGFVVAAALLGSVVAAPLAPLGVVVGATAGTAAAFGQCLGVTVGVTLSPVFYDDCD